MAIGFEAFDLAGKVEIDISDADKILVRLNRAAKQSDAELKKVETQADKTAAALKRLNAEQGKAGTTTKQPTVPQIKAAPKDVLKSFYEADEKARRKSQSVTEKLISDSEAAIAKNKKLQSHNATTAIISDLKRIEKERKHLDNISSAVAGRGVAGGAFLGTFAAQGFSSAIALTKDLASEIVGLGVKSVRLAAEFSQSERTIQVFAGSLGNARKELAAIDKLAAATPGLTLRDAEVGYTRLRALNFEAKVAQDLLIGISKQRIMSGADQDAVNRVIVNITQLASGSPRLTQDIKEMILAMPTLRQNIIETFGSLEKFKTELRLDPTGALEKFGEGMKNTQIRSVGFFDAIEKMQDAAVRMGREFGKPILSPLTQSILDATKYLNDNKNAWQSWGQFVGDVIEDFNNRPTFNQLPLVDPNNPNIRRAADGRLSVRYGQAQPQEPGILQQSAERGKALRLLREERQKLADIQKEFGNLAEEGYVPSQILKIDIDKIKEFREKAEQEAVKADREEKIRQTIRLQNIDNENEQRLSKLQSFYSIEQATLDSNLRQTLEQEKTFTAARARLQADDLKAQIVATNKFYNEKIKLVSNVDDEETRKLTNERNTRIRELNTQLVVNEINTQKQLKEISKRILDERRAALIEFNNIEIQGFGQKLESQTSGIEKAIDLQISTVEQGFDELVNVNFNAFQKIYDLTYQNYVKQLDDASLSAEQRKNIQAKMYLELEGLTESHNRKVLELDNRRYQEQINRLESFSRRAQSLFESQAGIFSSIGGFFQPESFSTKSLEAFQNAFLGTDLQKQVESLKKQREQSFKDLQELKSIPGATEVDFQGIEDLYNKLGDDVAKAEVKLDKFKDAAKGTEAEINRLGIALTSAAGSFANFDKIAEKALFAQQESELKAFTAQLKFAGQKLEILKDQFGSDLLGNVAKLESQIQSLENTTNRGTLENSVLEGLKAQLITAKEAYAGFEAGTRKTEGILDAENAITILNNSLINLTSKQAQERIELFSRSINGLRQSLIDLQSGDTATRNRLQDIFTKDLLEEQIGSYTEIEQIKFRLANTPLINAQAIEIAQLEEIVKLRNEAQQKAESKAIVGNRVNILDNLSRQQREQALKDKQFEQSRSAAGQTAALARIKGLENEEELKTQILKDTAEKYLEIERKYQESLGNIKRGDGAVRPKAENLDAFDKLSGAAKFGLGTFGITEIQTAEEVWKNSTQNMLGITQNAFGGMADAIGQSVEAWVLYGDSVGGSLSKATAAILANVAAQATTQAVWETAQGLAMLALNYFIPNPNTMKSAIAHFASAGVFAGIAGGTAIAGRAVAGNQFNQGGTGGQSGNAQQPDYYTSPPTQQPQQITPQQVQSPRTNESATIARLEGVIKQLSDSINKQGEAQIQAIDLNTQVTSESFGRIGGMSPGTILVAGAKERPGTFGKETLEDLKNWRTSPTDFRKGLGTS